MIYFSILSITIYHFNLSLNILDKIRKIVYPSGVVSPIGSASVVHCSRVLYDRRGEDLHVGGDL
jgi:hypothetical protein